MNWKRFKAIGKLVLLFGTPLVVVLGLFGFGVYVGDLYRHDITTFEKDWLGLDVEVAPPHEAAAQEAESKDTSPKKTSTSDEPEVASAPEKAEPEKAEQEKAEQEKAEPETPDSTEVKTVAQVQAPAPDSAVDVPVDPTPAQQPAVADPVPAALPQPAPPVREVQPQVDPLEGDLVSRLAIPVTVGVKVLVDDALVEQHPDWIDYAQRTVSRASSVYEKLFGVTLELVSVGRWGVPTAGLSSSDLLAEVEAQPREAAQVVIGLTGRPFDDRTSGKAYTPPEDGPYNGSAAVVYALKGGRDQHVRGVLHEVSHLFGALDVTDPAAAAYRSGSWMSYAAVGPDQAPWIDPSNRARILARKDKPFAPKGSMQQPQTPAVQRTDEVVP